MKSLLLPIFCLIAGTAFSQAVFPQNIGSGGGFAQNSTVFLNYSIGQPVISTLIAGSNILTQGYQQPDIYVVNSLHHTPYKDFNIMIYPNPTANALHIDILEAGEGQVQYAVLDMLGRELARGELWHNAKNIVHLGHTAPGQYVLQIADREGHPIKTFTLHKIN